MRVIWSVLFLGWVGLAMWSCTETVPPSEQPSESMVEKGVVRDGGEPHREPVADSAPPEPTPEPTKEVKPEPTPEPVVEPAPDKTWPPGTPPACPVVTPSSVPSSLKLPSFYKKYVNAGGIPIVASDKVPTAAFQRAYYIIANMLRGKPCIRKALAMSGIRMGIIGDKEVTLDMPEYSDLNKAFPGTDWNKRARGLGATWVRPLTTGSEENLLLYPNNRWKGEQIFLHEVAHSFFEFGVRALKEGPTHQKTLETLYADAKKKGLWKNTYAMTNANEYWAETVQSWFSDNIDRDPPDGIHNNVNTRKELKSYDPKMAAFISKFFDATPWPVACATDGQGPAWKDPTPKDPMAATCEFHEVLLKDLGCKTTPRPSSTDSKTSGRVLFLNRSMTETIKIFWVDRQGSKRAYGTLGPRSQRSLSSFQTHAWVLEKNDGSYLGVYQLTHPANVIAVE